MEISDKRLNEFSSIFQERTGLSPTRSKVLVLLKTHHSKEEIADRLQVTEQTVQNHIQDIRKEITFAEELTDIAGRTHYDNTSYFKEFAGSVWMFRAGLEYNRNEDTHIQKKLYGSSTGATLLVERETIQEQGSITETRTRTEFYSGNDVPPHLYRQNQFESYTIADLYTTFVATAGIDPKFAPSDLVQNFTPEEQTDRVTVSDDGWVTISNS